MATRTLPPPPKSKKKTTKKKTTKSSAKPRSTKKATTKKKTTKKASTKKAASKKKSTKKKTSSRGKGKTLAPKGKLTAAGAKTVKIDTHKDESIEGEYLKRSTHTGETKKVTAETRKAYVPKTGITDAQRRQLAILEKNPGISPADFARKAWPDSEGWKKTCHTGIGRNHEGEAKEVPGGAMVISAGAALGKLRLAGWADFEKQGRKKLYSITAEGKKALKG